MAQLALQETTPRASVSGSNRPMVNLTQPAVRDERLTALFEELLRARGVDAWEARFRALQAEPAERILNVGLQQYAYRGNAKRLTVTADLLAAAGSAGAQCLQRFLNRHVEPMPRLIFFVDAIAGASTFTEDERRSLLVSIAQQADEDTAYRLEEISDSLEPETARAVRAALNRG